MNIAVDERLEGVLRLEYQSHACADYLERFVGGERPAKQRPGAAH